MGKTSGIRYTAATLSVALLAATTAGAQSRTPRTTQPPADPEIYLVPLAKRDSLPVPGTPVNVTKRVGYDNQPSFTPDGRALLFTSNRGDGQTDIYRLDLATREIVAARATRPESEYSAVTSRDGKSMHVIRVEADSTQRLWQLSLNGGLDAPLFADIRPVGYYAQADDSTWAMFVLGSPATLQVARIGRPGSTTITRNVGRSLHRIPGTSHVSFVQKGGERWYAMELDPSSGKLDTLVATLPGREDLAWVDGTTLLAGSGSTLYAWRRGDTQWREIANFSSASLTNITRLAVSPAGDMLAMVADAVPPNASKSP